MFQVIKEKAELSHLEFFISSIKSFLKKTTASETAIYDVILVSEEILVNVMSYAYPEKSDGEIEVHCNLMQTNRGNKLNIIFIDSGIPFDILDQEPPDLSAPIEERNIGGLGIHLVKTLMDEVSYTRKDEKNILSVIKNI